MPRLLPSLGPCVPSGHPTRELHLQDGDNNYRVFTKSDGTKTECNHDYLVRRTPTGAPDDADPGVLPGAVAPRLDPPGGIEVNQLWQV
jgi:hypothetical protein